MIRFKSPRALLCTALVLAGAQAFALDQETSPKGAKVSISSPADGAVVENPVKVTFSIENMTLIPAGTKHPDSGHHHLLVDVDKLPPMNQPIPADKQHIHFGKAQTETELTLTPGKHTLQLLLGDHFHRPHNPPVMSKPITITVKAPAEQKTDKQVKAKQ